KNFWPKSEVQKISDNAHTGEMLFYTSENGTFLTAGPLPYNATAAQLQTALEGIYGAGNVTVEVGQGGSGTVYTVTTEGALRDLPVAPLNALAFSEPQAVAAEVVREGGSGEVIVTATNMGFETIDASSAPVSIVDQLPAGVSAAAISG